jgi:Fic family protein
VETVNVLIESKERPSFCTGLVWKKVKNIYNAAMYLSKRDPLEMNIDSILSVHQYVADGLLTHSIGELRQRDVGAANTGITYLPHRKVESHIRGLIEFVGNYIKRRYSDTKESFLHTLKIGCIFYSEFLKIHPFVDGNGRTARLILGSLMQECGMVPFTLFLNGSQETYLKVLQEAQWQNNMNSLYTYILCCIQVTMNKTNYLLL